MLAFELTKIVHNEQEATKAQQAAKSLFEKGAAGGSVPTTEMSTAEFVDGIDIITLLTTAGIVPSRSEARRLVQQGGGMTPLAMMQAAVACANGDSAAAGQLAEMMGGGKRPVSG